MELAHLQSKPSQSPRTPARSKRQHAPNAGGAVASQSQFDSSRRIRTHSDDASMARTGDGRIGARRQPVPYSPSTPHGMPADCEQYHLRTEFGPPRPLRPRSRPAPSPAFPAAASRPLGPAPSRPGALSFCALSRICPRALMARSAPPDVCAARRPAGAAGQSLSTIWLAAAGQRPAIH